MEDVDVAVRGVCFKVDDCTGQSLVNRIQCEMCTVWYHELCINSEPDIFVSLLFLKYCDAVVSFLPS